MADCIFCEIIAGRAPASIVYQDDTCLAFMDIHPLGRGHVLIVPLEHAVQLPELPDAQRTHLFRVAHHILDAQRALGWGKRGSHILLNDGPQANQMVPHIHVHIIPREKRDALPTLSRLFLHITGLMGRATARTSLDEQASALRQQLPEIIH